MVGQHFIIGVFPQGYFKQFNPKSWRDFFKYGVDGITVWYLKLQSLHNRYGADKCGIYNVITKSIFFRIKKKQKKKLYIILIMNLALEYNIM